MTLATAAVEIRLQFDAAFAVILDAPEMLPFRAQRFWKRIHEAKRDELCQSRFIAMRQIPTLVPSTEPALRVRGLWTGRPLPLACNEIAHTGIVWRPGTTRFGRQAHAAH